MTRLQLIVIAAAMMALVACERGQRRLEAATVIDPGPRPERVILTWDGSTATTQSVTWRTRVAVSRARAQITVARAEPFLAADARDVEAQSEVVELATSDWNVDLDPSSVSYHSVSFTDLEPATLYAYRVGSDQAWSEWHHFRTASATPEPFTFLYFGDAQNGVLSHWSRVLRTAYQTAPQAAFAIHAGDLVDRGHQDLEWSQWHAAGGWLNATLPSVPVTGNHEYRAYDRERTGQQRLAIQWRPQFALPVLDALSERLAETVYTLDYQGTRFFVLNSNRALEEQATWLDAALSSADRSGVNWKIVTLHHPIFSNTTERDNPGLRSLLLPILERHDVDLVLQGHDHTYSRGHVPAHFDRSAAPVENSAGENTRDQQRVGPIFVVSVSGAKQYEVSADRWDRYEGEASVDRMAENTQFFQVVDVEPDRIGYRAYTATGSLYDGFELMRNEQGDRVLVDLPVVSQVERRHDNTEPYSSGHW